ncbi:DUF1758 domain-containing protein [Trichonephila inaurata madagascariensis]|uniref:DUF1758 domain-containing protein n=1 Tax=Trichonephila inaurata madagascariensis TaxID=2747483 RepID=A0A8X6YXZ4_9ARAC|nr:DUF1758 domain-containing protein [Trichonephila inaurata madagascariensis]
MAVEIRLGQSSSRMRLQRNGKHSRRSLNKFIQSTFPVCINSKIGAKRCTARLYATCKNILKEYDVHFYAWTDSQVVLSWLSSHPRNWKPYIANRTSEILDLVPADSWCYVPTKMNPSDIACRGLSPKELPTCVLRWESPQWLSCEMDFWPKQPKRDDQLSDKKKMDSF